MGGDARSLILPLPIGERGTSSWAQHQRRDPRSTEPGTDIFAPTGTPVLAPADGVIYGYGESVSPATGRWVGIDFDNGMSFRCMHHSRILRKGGRVRQGDEIALSGSSGYGSDFFGRPSRDAAFWRDTGGDHSHVTLWPTRDKRFGYGRDGDPNKPYTIDIMDFIREDDMPLNNDDLNNIAARVWDRGIGQDGGGENQMPAWQRLSWAHSDASNAFAILRRLGGPLSAEVAGVPDDKTDGTLPVRVAWIDYQARNIAARMAGLEAAVTALAQAQGVDPAKITAAVEGAVKTALADIEITLRAQPER